jgi:hypothetical protein
MTQTMVSGPSGGQGSPPVNMACNRSLPQAGGEECQRLLSAGDRAATISTVALVSAPVLAAAALVLYLTTPASGPEAAAAPVRIACAPALGLGVGCAATF